MVFDILEEELDLYRLPLPDKVQIEGKYNEFIPLSLLRKQFIEDYLDFEGLKADITSSSPCATPLSKGKSSVSGSAKSGTITT